MNETQDFQKMGVDFQSALKSFIERSDKLSKNGLSRVGKALAAYPLEEGIIKLRGEDEEEVYKVGVEIQSIKLNMMIESLRQDAEETRIEEVRKDRENKEKNEKA